MTHCVEDAMTANNTPVSRSLLAVAGISALILVIPLAAMQFTTEVAWTLSDFIIMGILLMSAGTAYVVGSRMFTSAGQRLVVGALVGLVFLLVWLELAVGVFGTPFAGS
jgi:hypothetical protein